jgi:DNA-binding XRE family transcriptional regulator
MTTEHDNAPTIAWEDSILAKQAPLGFGNALRCYRQAEGWTLKEAGQKLGISPQLVHAYEKEKKLPSMKLACSLAHTYGMSEAHLLLLLINAQLNQLALPYQVRLAG